MRKDIKSLEYKAVVREYSQRAKSYDNVHKRFISESQNLVLRSISLYKDKKILDIGCGTGAFIYSILKFLGDRCEIVGIDISDEMLNIAKKRLRDYKNTFLIRAKAEAIPYPESYFDVICCINVLQYWRDINIVVAEFLRVLKDKGRLFLVGFCTDYLPFKVIERVWRWLIPSHRRAYSLKEMSLILDKAGFNLIKAENYKIGWFWSVMLIECEKYT